MNDHRHVPSRPGPVPFDEDGSDLRYIDDRMLESISGGAYRIHDSDARARRYGQLDMADWFRTTRRAGPGLRRGRRLRNLLSRWLGL